MPTIDEQFRRELEIFRTEEEKAAQFYFAFLAVHDVAYRHKSVAALLNRAPLFWNTCLGGLQAAAFIALGRVFDLKSPHNLEKLLRMVEGNPQVFSKAALARRKQGNEAKRPEWLGTYLRSVHEPTLEDFRRLRAHVQKWRQIYNANYRAVRHKFFAHKEAADEAAVTALFRKGTNRELQRMLTFLGSLHQALRQLFYDGRKPVLRPARYSLKEMRKKPVPAFFSGVLVQEHITREAQEFLMRVAKQ
jgi:hypothetical protein